MSVIVEAVTVSVNYSYYLSKCISNKEKLDRWIVVTEKQDTKCINLCKSNNIEYVLYDGFYTNDAIFAKGRGVNFGLSLLDKTDWLLHMDSDVCLPEDFRTVLKNPHSADFPSGPPSLVPNYRTINNKNPLKSIIRARGNFRRILRK